MSLICRRYRDINGCLYNLGTSTEARNGLGVDFDVIFYAKMKKI